jgi:acetyl-CoA carboxylase carboxyl transferase subunit alpha
VGEGGSGGALAIGVGDRVLMLQYSTYSVISPEGCASILWKSADKAQLAAEAMAITSDKLKEQGLIDEILPEPLGGAHRDPGAMAKAIKKALIASLDALKDRDLGALVDGRYRRLMGYGRFKDKE